MNIKQAHQINRDFHQQIQRDGYASLTVDERTALGEAVTFILAWDRDQRRCDKCGAPDVSGGYCYSCYSF